MTTDATTVGNLIIERNVSVLMRDGVALRADVYRPAEGRWPALLQRTPYDKAGFPGLMVAVNPVRAALEGYVVIVQDTRGRFESEGNFTPFVHEGEDGVDTIAWAAAQPWCDGRVAMFGSSYMAAAQMQAVVRTPLALTAICPVQASSDYYEGRSYRGGAFELGALVTLALWALGNGTLRRKAADSQAFRKLGAAVSNLEQFVASAPLNELRDTILGEVGPFVFDWMEHDQPDDYWEALSVEKRYAQTKVPALHISSWYDPFHIGTLRNYEGMRAAAATPEARGGQSLIIGPWGHYPPKISLLGSVRIAEVDFGLRSFVDLEGIQLAWFNRQFKDDATGWTQRLPVRLFVMGRNFWREEETWPLERSQVRPLYMDSADHLTWELPAESAPCRYDFDPKHPVPTRGGAHLLLESMFPQGPVDQRELESRRDVLVYTSEILSEDLEVTGWVEAELWVASSAPCTDFTVKLIDVWPTGQAHNVVDGIRRVQLAASASGWAKVVVELGATSMVFRAGHALRVHISSSNFPRFDINPNTGMAAYLPGERVVAHQQVAIGGAFASRVMLPVVTTPPSAQ